MMPSSAVAAPDWRGRPDGPPSPVHLAGRALRYGGAPACALTSDCVLWASASGYGFSDLTPAQNASDGRCLLVALVQVLANYESRMSEQSWRRNGSHTAEGRYLRFLQSCGYTFAEVEEFAISKKTA